MIRDIIMNNFMTSISVLQGPASNVLFVFQFQAVLLFAKVPNNGLLKRRQYNCSNSLPHCDSWLLEKVALVWSPRHIVTSSWFFYPWGIQVLPLTNTYCTSTNSYNNFDKYIYQLLTHVKALTNTCNKFDKSPGKSCIGLTLGQFVTGCWFLTAAN